MDKNGKASSNHGFTNDSSGTAGRSTAAQKVTRLKLRLGQIATYYQFLSLNSIVKNSTPLNAIWRYVNLHYGFQSSGSPFLDHANIKLEAGEHPEDLYQCWVGGLSQHSHSLT